MQPVDTREGLFESSAIEGELAVLLVSPNGLQSAIYCRKKLNLKIIRDNK